MVEVGFAELHKTLFLGGKNHGERLDTHRFPDLKIELDEKKDRLQVTWKGHTTMIPMTNVASYTEGRAADRKIVQMASPQVANVSSTAQVETPMSHVHAGHGHGKTGISKGVK